MNILCKYFLVFLRGHRVKRTLLSMSAVLSVLLLLPVLTGTVFANLALQEMPLVQDGGFYNVHADAQGNLWIADQHNGKLWRLDASDSDYKVYRVHEYPFDALPDTTGGVWWLYGLTLNRLDSESAATQKWDFTLYLSDYAAFFGAAIDGSGKIWVTDGSVAKAYRFDPSSGQFCSYTLPANATGSYPAVSGAALWFGDFTNGQLIRIDSDLNTVTGWQLPSGSYPEDVALDASGNVWYTDKSLAQIGRLDPITNGLRVYALPTGTLPFQLVAAGGKIWYTEQKLPSLGKLNPDAAVYTPSQLTPTSNGVTPSCAHVDPIASATATTSTGTQGWPSNTYTTLVNAGGWSIYQLPAGAFPWGITATDNVYMVDRDRKLVARISLQPQVTACKTQDRDGNVGTSGDRTPVAGWTLYLTKNNARQLPGKTTGADGCAAWPNLTSGTTYGVEEDSGADWVALAGTSYSFGASQPGGDYQYTFINALKPSLTLVNAVVNDNGGAQGVSDFPLFISGSPATSGVAVRLSAGSYTASETPHSGYTASAWGGDCAANGSVTLAVGDDKTCTITNNDTAPALHLRKAAVNDNGGSAPATAWTLTANGGTAGTLSGATPVDSGAAFKAGAYTLSESGGPAGYNAGAWSCIKNNGAPVSSSSISLALGDIATCTITNDDIAPVLHLRKVVVNSGGGTALATDWTLSASGPSPLSGHTPVDSGAAFSAGTYTLSEAPVIAGYHASAWACVGGSQNGSQVTLTLGQTATCTITDTFKPYKAFIPNVRK